MATMLERSTMIFHGVFGRPPNNQAELGKWAERLLCESPEAYAALGAIQKVRVIPLKVRQMFIRDGRAYRAHVAASSAKNQAEDDFDNEVDTEVPDPELDPRP